MSAIKAAMKAVIVPIVVTIGRMFGTAFQLVDDIQNFNSSPGWTKDCGEDIVAGKLTYVILKELEMSMEKERGRLGEILCRKELREDPVYHCEAVGLIRSSGALEECRAMARNMIDIAWSDFSEAVPPSEPKIFMRLLCHKLLNVMCET